jgi:hypothetical protein
VQGGACPLATTRRKELQDMANPRKRTWTTKDGKKKSNPRNSVVLYCNKKPAMVDGFQG